MLKIFVDESGNLGTQGRYFAIGALIIEDGKRIRNIFKRHCAKERIDEYKNREATFPQQQELAQKMKRIDYGRKIRLDFVTYGYSTINFCTHRTTYRLTKYM